MLDNARLEDRKVQLQNRKYTRLLPVVGCSGEPRIAGCRIVATADDVPVDDPDAVRPETVVSAGCDVRAMVNPIEVAQGTHLRAKPYAASEVAEAGAVLESLVACHHAHSIGYTCAQY